MRIWNDITKSAAVESERMSQHIDRQFNPNHLPDSQRTALNIHVISYDKTQPGYRAKNDDEMCWRRLKLPAEKSKQMASVGSLGGADTHSRRE